MPADPAPLDLEALLALEAKATEGPWTACASWETRDGVRVKHPPMVWDCSGDSIVNRLPDGRPYFEANDATFIAEARNAFRALVARVRAAEQERAKEGAEVKVLCDEVDALNAKLRAARAALEECAGALEPFASICVPGETWVGTDPATLLLITKRDLERAAAAARKAREVGGGR
jgi:hypothetical protein